MKKFNTTAVCIPSKHYMVDISDKIAEIKSMVDAGYYFTINRARQYGKTTTLKALQQALKKEYIVLGLSFESITEANFAEEQSFVRAFCRLFKKNPDLYALMPEKIKVQIDNYIECQEKRAEMDELFLTLGEWCAVSDRPIVLLVDEVDSASNSQVFLDFLSLLRDRYISREADGIPAFQSVILAGVTDIRYLKSKIRDEAVSKVNSPWNIAADFTVDMSLSKDGIRGMLEEYEADHHTGMNTGEIAKLLREYTNGYPFLVSRLCQLIDEVVCKTMDPEEAWTKAGFEEAVKLLLSENNPLFKSLTAKLENYPEIKASLHSILMEGKRLSWNGQQDAYVQMQMYGFIKQENNTIRIANRIFETLLYNLFLSDEDL
ncbi:MAG: AAA-like domain-containing protein, partial [Lachnospiraceae bacterium]|nr:AAA-like domain-containing protein [Lachnospiraceae bacterium]